jgi:hypothetical protein
VLFFFSLYEIGWPSNSAHMRACQVVAIVDSQWAHCVVCVLSHHSRLSESLLVCPLSLSLLWKSAHSYWPIPVFYCERSLFLLCMCHDTRQWLARRVSMFTRICSSPYSFWARRVVVVGFSVAQCTLSISIISDATVVGSHHMPWCVQLSLLTSSLSLLYVVQNLHQVRPDDHRTAPAPRSTAHRVLG